MNDIPEPGATALQTLLFALATVTHEVGEHLETTSSAIGQDLQKSGDLAKPAIVKLQGFDRMRQQLAAVSEVLRRCSALISNCDAAAPQSIEQIISQISMRQMRHRLQDALDVLSDHSAADVEEEQVF